MLYSISLYLHSMDLFEDDEYCKIIQYLNYQRCLYTVHEKINHMLMWVINNHDFRLRYRLEKYVVLIY